MDKMTKREWLDLAAYMEMADELNDSDDRVLYREDLDKTVLAAGDRAAFLHNLPPLVRGGGMLDALYEWRRDLTEAMVEWHAEEDRKRIWARQFQCAWFARCKRQADTVRRGPVGDGEFGEIPICSRCDAKIEAL